MRLSERTRKTRGAWYGVSHARRIVGSLGRRNPVAGVHGLSSTEIGRAPGSERVPLDTRKSPLLLTQGRGRHYGEHPVDLLETNGAPPMPSRQQVKLVKNHPSHGGVLRSP